MRTAIWMAACEYWSRSLGEDYEISAIVTMLILVSLACALCEDLRAAFGDRK